MECKYCHQPTEEKRNFAYSYDVRGTHFPKGEQWLEPCCKPCWNIHWNEATRYWDDVDELMNRNKYFIRDKGMVGKYKDGDKEYGPVYAQWKRCDIEGNFLPYKSEDMQHIEGFRLWLEENKLVYRYEAR